MPRKLKSDKMNRAILTCLSAVALAGAGSAVAQSSGTPVFHAPYRAFANHESGGSVSFPRGGDFALEGFYSFGRGTWDVGLRGGLFDPGGQGATQMVVGVTGRQRVVTHSEQFPLDGAVVLGAGLNVDGGTALLLPAGISLGRRLDVADSEISIVPYVQPGLALLVNGGAELGFVFGAGADVRLSPFFDARVSVGLASDALGIEGVAISAVWIR